MKISHYIEHLFGWNCGQVISKLDEDRNVWIAFQCSTCGKISGAHKSKIRQNYHENAKQHASSNKRGSA